MLWGCDEGEATGTTADPPTRVAEIVSAIDLPRDAIVGRATGMAWGAANETIFVSDYQAGVVRIGLDDGSASVVCRVGEGPGEVVRPAALVVVGDTLVVADAGNQRLLFADFDCREVRTRKQDFRGYAFALSLNDRGAVADPTGGFGEGLVELRDSTGVVGSPIGVPEPLPPEMSLAMIRAEIQDGGIPALFRNNVLVAHLGEDVVLAALGSGWIARYSAESTELWRSEVGVGEYRNSVMAEVRALNAEEVDRNRIHPIEFYADIAVAAGRVWVLGSPLIEGGRVWALDAATGALIGTWDFAALGRPTALLPESDSSVFVLDGDGARLVELALRAATPEN